MIVPWPSSSTSSKPFKPSSTRSPITTRLPTASERSPVETTKAQEPKFSSFSRDDFRLFLDSSRFIGFWWMVSVFRGCEITFLGAMFWLYHWLLHNPKQQVSSIDGLTFQFSYSTLGMLNWTFGLLVVLQLFMLCKSLVYSCKARELRFTDDTHGSGSSRAAYRSVWVVKVWKGIMKKWFEPVLYIHGKYFDQYFLLREYIEVASQVYQAYQMSVYIPTRWINNLFVSMVFLNCLSTPIIHWLVPSSRVPLRRLLGVICSAFLNFVNSVVIPFLVFFPYPSKYDTGWCSFDIQDLYDDVWYARALRENQQLFVTSYVDFVATWMPHWSQFTCLVACEDLVRRRGRHLSERIRRPKRIPSRIPDAEKPSETKTTTASHRSRIETFLSRHGLWLIGVVVLAIHLTAQSQETAATCKLQSTPWFVTETSCVVMNVNCYRRGIEGNAQQVHDTLSKISTKSLFQVIFSHCPRLQMPPIISEFHQLTGLDLYNCTIDKWPSDSAISEANHPKMIYLAAYLVNMSGIPQALLLDLPSHLNSVYLIETNLTALPDDLHQHWPMVVDHYVLNGQFDRFPPTFAKFQRLDLLDFVGNRIQSIIETDLAIFFGNELLQSLCLSNSNVSALPPEFTGDLDHLMVLNLEFTQVQQIPTYLLEWFVRKVTHQEFVQHSLYGSPFCNAKDLPLHEDADQRFYRSQVCSLDLGTGVLPEFFYVVQKQRQL